MKAKRKIKACKGRKSKKIPYAIRLAKWRAEVQKSLNRTVKILKGLDKTLNKVEKDLDEADAAFDKAVQDATDEIIRKMGDDDPGEPELAPSVAGDDAAELGSPDDV